MGPAGKNGKHGRPVTYDNTSTIEICSMDRMDGCKWYNMEGLPKGNDVLYENRGRGLALTPPCLTYSAPPRGDGF